ncbi:serine/threonine protein kinase [Mucilaginibacter paludis]|uniref:Serine/threonine protein kinase n=1 Tax=Mucilaginibacter paludis DSM 18603 TaxID=714943 RepID=H1Y404_9SPHI|nr:protein kinase [Mucilaginibacter paludis]EHQ30949.1 serine/threonine protein kinase [Mucilaginibacter paludis DSM 18603]
MKNVFSGQLSIAQQNNSGSDTVATASLIRPATSVNFTGKPVVKNGSGMEKAFYVHLETYAPILKSERIAYRENEKSLMVGKDQLRAGWVIFLSCKTLDTIALLKQVLPLLKSKNLSFCLVKNQITQYRLNAGAFGENEVGKVISIFPPSEEAAKQLVAELNSLTESYKGPVIPGALRLGNLVYVQLATDGKEPGQIQLSLPNIKKVPFAIQEKFRIRNRRKPILGKYYVPVQLLRASAKGDIFKAINLKKFAFNWCLIKQGKPVALDDHFDRDMRDRLLWQKEVLETIGPDIPTPMILDYFEEGDSTYLVLSFAEGESLGKVARGILNGKTWNELEALPQIQLLDWFLKAIIIVHQIHERGFVHRDITDSNFLVLENRELCIIDFELAYSIAQQKPNPPFLLGTFGYAAPEQIAHAVAHPKEDIYSLGALLCFLVTGSPPFEFINSNPNMTRVKLTRLTGNNALTNLIMQCLSLERRSRPEIADLEQRISTYINTIKTSCHA